LRLDLTHEELASATGVSRATQFAYENGSRAPDVLYLAKARDAGVDVLFVISGQRERGTPGVTSEERVLIDRYNTLAPPLRKTVDDVLLLATHASTGESSPRVAQTFHGPVGAVGDAARVKQTIKHKVGR
tara:strand:+ start:10745 stop:11134 length:390 start_codon:yes stop_codon:yes gene_type:complete